VVREESHLDEMRAAIRGDFERFERRRGTPPLRRPVERHAAPPRPERPAPPEESAQPPPSGRSWLSRLLGR
jgi:hypothetical protein